MTTGRINQISTGERRSLLSKSARHPSADRVRETTKTKHSKRVHAWLDEATGETQAARVARHASRKSSRCYIPKLGHKSHRQEDAQI